MPSSNVGLDNILNTRTKIKILRLFLSRREDFMASGREIARLIGLTPPTVHTALKELYNLEILKRDIIGKQHIYKLNSSNRTVRDILSPAFLKERSIIEDIALFLIEKIRISGLLDKIVSMILFGSLIKGGNHQKSDCDVAIIVKDAATKKQIENLCMNKIANEFSDYFGIHLDVYNKTLDEFHQRLKKNLPPVSTLMEAYKTIYGQDPTDFN